MHSGGAHVGVNRDGRPVLEAADALNPMKVIITPVLSQPVDNDQAISVNGNKNSQSHHSDKINQSHKSDKISKSHNVQAGASDEEGVPTGYYTIALPDGSKFLTLSGKYNTVYGEDGDAPEAHFMFEETPSGFFLKVKCEANGKYLGTDSSQPGAYLYADKNGSESLHYWCLTDTPDFEFPVEENSYIINPGAELQHFDGWGVSLCWWANMCGKWSDDKIDEIVDWLVSPEHLNFRFFRYNIGGGDDPDNANCTPHHMGNGKGLRAEMEGFKDSSDGPYIWERDAAQRKIMLKIREKRPDAVFEAFSNSCPWYMTYSGCVAGNEQAGKDNLKPEYYEEFAHYLVDVCKHYKEEYGLEFATLDPFNEPMTSYWGANGGQEGCHFDVASQIAFLKVLHPILRESGLKTVISASDETATGQSVADFIAYRDAGILPLVGQWNTHTYSADNMSRAQLSDLCTENNMPLWMSEVGLGGNGIGGNLSLALKLIADMRIIQPSAWIDWQYIEENNDQWCLVKSNSFADESYYRIKNFYIRSHFSRFIKEGYTILATLDSRTLAARSPEGDKLVIVAVNDGSLSSRHTVDLKSYKSVGNPETAIVTTADVDMRPLAYDLTDKELTFEIPTMSICTFVIPVTPYANNDAQITEGADFLIYPRANPSAVISATEEDNVIIDNYQLSDNTIWKLHKAGDRYTFINREGSILTENYPSYRLSVTKEEKDGQLFGINSIGGACYRIDNSRNDKSFDLESKRLTPGTAVGMWKYEGENAPVHRQWGFLALPREQSGVELRYDDATEPLVKADSPSAGILRLQPVKEICKVMVYRGDASKIYENDNLSATALLPVSMGIYLVTAQAGTERTSQAILVK